MKETSPPPFSRNHNRHAKSGLLDCRKNKNCHDPQCSNVLLHRRQFEGQMAHRHQNQRHFDKSLDSHQFYGTDRGLPRYPQNSRAVLHAPMSESLPPIEQEYRPHLMLDSHL